MNSLISVKKWKQSEENFYKYPYICPPTYICALIDLDPGSSVRSGLRDHSPVDIWDWVTFVVGSCPVYYRMFYSIPALYSLDAHSTPPQVVTTENIPWGDKNLEGSWAMSTDTLGCHDGVGYWQIVGRDQACGETSYNAQDSTHNKKLSGLKC